MQSWRISRGARRRPSALSCGRTNARCSSRAGASGTRSPVGPRDAARGLSRGAVISAPEEATVAMIVRKGTVPSTPHTEFYAIPNVLAREEIHGSYGFSGAWSRKVHVRFYPTEQVKPPRKGEFDLVPEFPPEADILQPYHIFTGRIPFEGDALSSRKPIVHGPRTSISVSKPMKSMPNDTFFRNGERHEVYFVQDGDGVLRSEYGDLKFRKDVYVAIPKGTTYRIDLTSTKAWFPSWSRSTRSPSRPTT